MKVQVARIGKPHGIRGEVTVQVFTDDPEHRLARGMVLEVEPAHPLAPAGTLTVTSSRWNNAVLVLGFQEATTRNDAEALRGTRLVLDTEEEETAEGWYEHELTGLAVYTAATPAAEEIHGPVGTVTALRTLPTQDLLVLELADGSEALVPFVEEIVPEVDPEEGRVIICPPPGLLELNAAEPSPAAGDRP